MVELRGKHVVLTGTLSILKRKEAIAFLEDKGALVQGAVSGKTDILIVGHRQTSLFRKDTRSKKQQAALARQEAGQDIYLMSEEEFFDLFQNGTK